MTVLVVGASGATGRLVVEQLLASGQRVKVIVRSLDALHELWPSNILQNNNLLITEASILDLSNAQLAEQVSHCNAVISCLGHNLTLRGMFALPRRLVTESVQRLCTAINAQPKTKAPVKFILMNTTGNINEQAAEKVSISQALTLRLIRVLLPPHADNEAAARYLQNHYGAQQDTIEWLAVRPDSLINEALVSRYDVYASPIRSAIFDAGKTSRINVAHFMARLVTDNTLWEKWKGQMPVIYNAD